VGGKGSGRRKRTASDLVDDKRSTGRPEKPTWLDETASWFWDQCVEELIDMGVATKIDGPSLVMLSAWYSRWIQLARAERSSVVDLQRAGKEFGDLARQFGLTPSSRHLMRSWPAGDTPRPVTSQDMEPVDALTELLKARNG
jgi:phage terminase small subunit